MAFILAAFPLALLFATVPIPLAAIQTIQGFGHVSGNASAQDTAAAVIAIARTLRTGSIGFLIVMSLAALWQAKAAAAGRAAMPASSRSSRGNWILVLCPLLVLPVGLLTYVGRGAAIAIARSGVELTSAAEGTIASERISQMSALISSRITNAAVFGVALVLVVLVFAIASVIAVRFSRLSEFLARYSWSAFSIASALALWNVIDLTLKISSFSQAQR